MLVGFLCVIAVLAGAGAASAAPIDPTMSLVDLQTMLDASGTGTVDGYFKTVIQGTTIVDIPCTITGIAPGAGADGGPLIIFNATGPVIDNLGGIAAGMSGSPIYVNDGVGDKLVGAVSYGVQAAGGGFGMATPIERMMTIEGMASKTLTVRTLDQPMRADGRLVSRVVIAPTRLVARTVKPRADTIVLVPLAELQITGIPADTTMYRTLKHLMENEGIDIRNTMLVAPTGIGASGSSIPPLVPGASVAAMLTRGDPVGPDYLDDSVYFYGVGGIGTVTYTTADGKLVAWGHPFFSSGRSGMYMNDANVLETVPSILEPFKLAVPGVTPRGTFTEDGMTGIAGTTDTVPTEVPISVHAVDSDTGKTVDRTSYVTSWVASQAQFAGLVPAAIWPALWQASGDSQFDGTISYTVVIHLNDGTNEYTITRTGMWDSTYDASTVLYLDLALDMMRLTANIDGVAAPTLESVSVSATMTHQHSRARIADVSAPGGLHIGPNTVHVTFWQYGSTTDRIIDVPLTIPSGTSLNGTLYVAAPDLGIMDLGGGWIGYQDPVDNNAKQRQTMGLIVDGINALPTGNQLQVVYDPANDQSYGDFNVPWGGGATVALVDAGAFTLGEKSKNTVRLSLTGMPTLVRRGGTTMLFGSLSHAAGPTTVTLYMRKAGQTTDTLLATGVPVTVQPSSHPWSRQLCTFTYLVRHINRTTKFTAVWDGDSAYLGATGKCRVRVMVP
jgi:hypothetical protein